MQEALVLFEVDETTYAVRSQDVERVEMVETITRVPNSPAFIEGVTSVRGQIIPVISVRKRFRLEPVPMDVRSRLIVVRIEERMVGMLVESAREFVRISTDQIKPLPESLEGPEIEYLQGVVTMANRLVLIVSLPKLINREERQEIREQSNESSFS